MTDSPDEQRWSVALRSTADALESVGSNARSLLESDDWNDLAAAGIEIAHFTTRREYENVPPPGEDEVNLLAAGDLALEALDSLAEAMDGSAMNAHRERVRDPWRPDFLQALGRSLHRDDHHRTQSSRVCCPLHTRPHRRSPGATLGRESPNTRRALRARATTHHSRRDRRRTQRGVLGSMPERSLRRRAA